MSDKDEWPETTAAISRLVRSWRVLMGLRALERARDIAMKLGDRDSADIIGIVITHGLKARD